MPSLKSGAPPSTASGEAGRSISSAAAAGLTVAVAGVSTLSSGRSFFATNPFSTRPVGHSQTSGTPAKDSDEAVDSDLYKLAQDTSRKRQPVGDDAEEEG